MQTSGMVSIRLDQQGRLLAFMAVPPQLQDGPGDSGEPNWSSLFDAAGLDRTEFEICPPIWTSTVASDMRQAWVSLASADSGADLRIEAAAFKGKPVFFQVIPSWRTPNRMVDTEEEVWAVPVVIAYTILIAVIVSSLLLARRNRRLGRTDSKGALRLALVFFAVIVLGGVFAGHLRPTPTSITLLFNAVAWGVFWAALIWAFYDALELCGRSGDERHLVPGRDRRPR